MSILGTDATTYDAYVAAIRREHAAIPAPLFAAGRRAFLESLLARPAIFHSRFFAERHEASARTNMARELMMLR
jgi:predicted metal-dependent HD superfamily phosphohydrolase